MKTKMYRIAILIEETKRTNLIEWSYFNKEILRNHDIIGNNIAADILQGTLNMPIERIAEVSADENRELISMISEKSLDLLIVFGNPLKMDLYPTGMSETMLLAIDQNILTAFNYSTADLVIRAIDANGSGSREKRTMKIA